MCLDIRVESNLTAKKKQLCFLMCVILEHYGPKDCTDI